MSKGSDGKGIVRFFVGIVEGTAFVGILTGVYLTMAPKADPNAGGPKGCGTLAQPADENGIMIAIAPQAGGCAGVGRPGGWARRLLLQKN